MQEHMIARQTVITPELLTAASMLVRISHPNDASLARALGKAECRLMELPWVVTEGLLQIASYSHPTDVNTTDGEKCTCPTSRGRCYHIACWYILSAIAAAGINPIAPLSLPLAALDDDIDEYPGDFLDTLDDTPAGCPLGARGVWYKGEYLTPEHLDAAEQGRQARNTQRVPASLFEEVDELIPFSRRIRPAPAIPFRLGPSHEMVAAPGSELERLQARANQMFAA